MLVGMYTVGSKNVAAMNARSIEMLSTIARKDLRRMGFILSHGIILHLYINIFFLIGQYGKLYISGAAELTNGTTYDNIS